MKVITSLPTLLLLLFVGWCAPAFSQEIEKPEKKKDRFEPSEAFLINPIYMVQFPYADMRTRFGINSLFQLNLSYKVKHNWMLGVEGGFLFGTNVKEGYILNNISTSTGQYITQNEQLASIRAQEQGYQVKFVVGKIIPFSQKFPDAGLLLQTGLGYLEHRIAINVKGTDLPQLDKTYRKGYDRLSSGPVLSQFIGGIFMERKKFFSAYAGVQLDVGFTQGRRNYDFYLQKPLRENRIDMFIGVKLGWIIPIFTQASEKEYYYY